MRDEYNKILIEDWEIDASIGVYDFEKSKPQKLIINIEIGFMSGTSFNNDEITHTLNYEEIISCVKNCISSRHFQLLENLAEYLCHNILNVNGTEWAALKIRKPAVLKEEKAGLLGIELKRYKKN